MPADFVQPSLRPLSSARRLVICLACWSLGLGAIGAETNSAPTRNPAAQAAPARSETLHFAVSRYELMGNTLLPDKALAGILSRHTGTNITFDDVSKAVKELQLEYHNRGYDTVKVTIPQQRLTNGVFKFLVFEGRLAGIVVSGNRYYTSNNVMRALPGLHTNLLLNSKLFQPQLDLANANQDRQIYAEIQPGPDSNTTLLVLRVKDRLPLHAKLEANDQSTPGTPELRLATSAVYDDLWQLDHSVGLQYTFSEEDYKRGGAWNIYDQPLVANYSAFYRLPLAAPESVAEEAPKARVTLATTKRRANSCSRRRRERRS